MSDLEFEFPQCMDFLISEPCRYKVLYGGRGAGKTENIAVALIYWAIQKNLRIACFREFQKSIAESVKATIEGQILKLGLSHLFNITDKSIVCITTGSEFIFLGLRYNINSLKSLSRIDIAWIDEANNVSRVSWMKLGPTIRGMHEDDPRGMGGPFGQGPEIIVSFNPELDSDETYQRFVVKPPSEFNSDGSRYSIVRKINYWENKWFPPDLRHEMEECRARSEDEYLEVWEGHTKQVLEGAVYAEEFRQALKDERIGTVRYDPNRPVFTFWDLGHSDKTAIWFAQTVGMEFNLINYLQDSLKKMPYYIGELQKLGYNYGGHYLPHDGDDETVSNISPKKQLQKFYPKQVFIVERPKRKFLGINAVRTIFPLCNFDENNCSDGLQCVKHYCYKVNEETGTFSREPNHDTPWSHGCDALQTMALRFKSEANSEKPKKQDTSNVLSLPSSSGWMQ